MSSTYENFHYIRGMFHFLKQEKSMENDVYGRMRSVAESYKERTNRSFWDDLRSEVSQSDCPSWIRRCFDGKEGMA